MTIHRRETNHNTLQFVSSFILWECKQILYCRQNYFLSFSLFSFINSEIALFKEQCTQSYTNNVIIHYGKNKSFRIILYANLN